MCRPDKRKTIQSISDKLSVVYARHYFLSPVLLLLHWDYRYGIEIGRSNKNEFFLQPHSPASSNRTTLSSRNEIKVLALCQSLFMFDSLSRDGAMRPVFNQFNELNQNYRAIWYSRINKITFFPVHVLRGKSFKDLRDSEPEQRMLRWVSRTHWRMCKIVFKVGINIWDTLMWSEDFLSLSSFID